MRAHYYGVVHITTVLLSPLLCSVQLKQTIESRVFKLKLTAVRGEGLTMDQLAKFGDNIEAKVCQAPAAPSAPATFSSSARYRRWKRGACPFFPRTRRRPCPPILHASFLGIPLKCKIPPGMRDASLLQLENATSVLETLYGFQKDLYRKLHAIDESTADLQNQRNQYMEQRHKYQIQVRPPVYPIS